MDWIQLAMLMITLIGIAASNIGLILWFRSESRSDWRHIDARLDAYMTQSRQEMKDFHARLCVLEERRLQFEMGKR